MSSPKILKDYVVRSRCETCREQNETPASVPPYCRYCQDLTTGAWLSLREWYWYRDETDSRWIGGFATEREAIEHATAYKN